MLFPYVILYQEVIAVSEKNIDPDSRIKAAYIGSPHAPS